MRFVAKAQERRKQDANMMMRGFVKIQTAKVLCLRLQCLERIRADVLKFTTGTEEQVNKMSDDLISRKALLEVIDISFIIPILKMNLRPEHEAVLKIREIIMNMPTAFDEEKVIEELRSEIELCVTHPLYPGRYIRKDRAVGTVEKGGIE